MSELSPAEIGELNEGAEARDPKIRPFLRAAVRRSLYAYVKIVTCANEKPNLFDKDVFKERQDWIQDVVCNTKRGLCEDPRGHTKTTGTSDSLPPWIAIQRPHVELDFPEEVERANAFLASHPHIRGVDSRVVVASESKERAAIFVGTSFKHWNNNALLRWLFFEHLWENSNVRTYGHWSEGAYSLRGRLNPMTRDDFLRAIGIDSSEQGGRADALLMIDDLLGEKSRHSVTEVQRRRIWLRAIGNLMENADYHSPQAGAVLLCENRLNLDDVNSMVHNELTDWAIWRRGAFRCYVHGAGNCGRWGSDETKECAFTDEPLWKARYPDAESLERVRRDKGDAIFNTEWLNDPTASAELDDAKFKEFTIEDRVIGTGDEGTPMRRAWCVVVPRVAENGLARLPEIIPLAALSGHLISIDPASSRETGACRTAVSWFAIDGLTGRVFWLDCRADRWGSEKSVVEAYKLWREAFEMTGVRPEILIEKVAAQSYFVPGLKFLATNDRELDKIGRWARRQIPEPMLVPPAHGVSKDDRIRRRLGWRLGQGLMYLRAGLQLPRTEVRHFPNGSKDALDTEVQAEEKYLAMNFGSVGSDELSARRRAMRRARISRAGSAGVLP